MKILQGLYLLNLQLLSVPKDLEDKLLLFLETL